MRYIPKVIAAVAMCVLLSLIGFFATRAYISDALAQGASEVDAGPQEAGTTRTPDEQLAKHDLVDPVQDPGGALDAVKSFYAKGGLTFVVLVVLMLAAAVYTRMKPKDMDGDGLPDVGGTWRDRTWAISGAVIMAGFPLFDKLTGVVGVNWSGVMVGLAGALALFMNSLNPIRGLNTPEVQAALPTARLVKGP